MSVQSFPDDVTSAIYPTAQVYVDEPRFARVLANLVSNALKFTPQGGAVTVTSTVIPTAAPTNTDDNNNSNSNGGGSAEDKGKEYRLRICVTDTGPGISKVYLQISYIYHHAIPGTGGLGSFSLGKRPFWVSQRAAHYFSRLRKHISGSNNSFQ